MTCGKDKGSRGHGDGRLKITSWGWGQLGPGSAFKWTEGTNLS